MPRPLPQLRRPPGLLRRPVGDPGTCAARRGNAVHGGVSAVSRGGILLHAPVGCNPPLGSAVTRTPSVPTACRGAPRRDLWTKPSRIPRSRPPTLPKIRKVRRPHPGFIFLAFMGFPFPIQTDGSHTQAASSMLTVITHPRGFPHTPAPFPHTFPRLPHTTTKLQKSRHWFQRDQRFRLSKPGTRGSPRIPCVACRRGTACPDGAPTRRDQRPVHPDPRIQPIHSNSQQRRN